MTTLKLSDLSGPDAAGWSDVAVFVRADGGESEPFVVTEVMPGGRGICYQRVDMLRPARIPTPSMYHVRRLGRGRLVPARIVMEGEADAEAKLREAIRDAGFAVMETSGKWSIHCVTDEAKRQREVDEQHTAHIINENIDLSAQVRLLREACFNAALTISVYHEASKILGKALAATAPKEQP